MKRTVAFVAAILVVLASAASATTVTEKILLNAYNIRNITVSDQDGGAGWYVGRHNTFDRLLDGGNDRPWLPAGDTQDSYWQMVYPTAMTVDTIRLSVTNEGGGTDFAGTGGKVQYTTVASPGPGDWNDLITGINTSGAHTYNITPMQVTGLRWDLPVAGHTTGGLWDPYLQYMNALGTNTVPIDPKYNLLPAHGTVITGGWNTTNSPAGVNDNDPAPRALWNTGACSPTSFIQMSLDKAYDASLLWVDWEGAGQTFRPNTFDLYGSYNGTDYVQLINDHVVAGDGTQDYIDLTTLGNAAKGLKALRIQDIQGAPWGHVIDHEIMLYGNEIVPVPEPATVVILGLGLLGIAINRKA